MNNLKITVPKKYTTCCLHRSRAMSQHAAGDEPGMGEVDDLPPDQGKQQAEDDAKQALAQAMTIAKRQGKLPAGLESWCRKSWRRQ